MSHPIGNLQSEAEALAPGHGLSLLPHLLQVGEEAATGCKLHKNEELFCVEESGGEIGRRGDHM